MARYLEDWLKSYLQYTQFNEAPDHFNFWSGVAAIAGALRRKVYSDQVYYRWSPNFYIILTAPSGVATKTTAMNAAMGLLKHLPSIHFGPDMMTWQAMLPALSNAQEEILQPNNEYASQACLTFASGEFGTLLDPQDRMMLSVLTRLWDGDDDAFTKATATMGSYTIINPWLNIIACTTPSWLADNFPPNAIGGGFTSRCIFVYADKKRQLVAYPKRMAERLKGLKWMDELQASLIHDLEAISLLSGEYMLSPEAELFGEVWYEDLYRNPPRNLVINSFDGYLARKQGHIHKLAMVIAASYKDELIITQTDLEKAIQLMHGIEDSMPKVFHSIRADTGGARINDVVSMVLSQGKVPRSVLYRMAFIKLSMGKKEFDDAINSAIDAGVVKQWLQAGNVLMLAPNSDLAQDTLDHTPDTEA